MIVCYLNPVNNEYFAMREDGEIIFAFNFRYTPTQDIENTTRFLNTVMSMLVSKEVKEIIT